MITHQIDLSLTDGIEGQIDLFAQTTNIRMIGERILNRDINYTLVRLSTPYRSIASLHSFLFQFLIQIIIE